MYIQIIYQYYKFNEAEKVKIYADIFGSLLQLVNISNQFKDYLVPTKMRLQHTYMQCT